MIAWWMTGAREQCHGGQAWLGASLERTCTAETCLTLPQSCGVIKGVA